MKKSSKIKALLLVMAMAFCTAGFAVGCEGKPDASTPPDPPTTEENGDNDNNDDNDSNDSNDDNDEVDEESLGYCVYFSTGQSGYTVKTKHYEPNQTVTLPTASEVPNKKIGNYECKFLHWANSLDDSKVTSLTMPATGNVHLYAVYDNGMQSGDSDFELTADGYRAVDSTSHGALNSLTLANDGDVYSLDMVLPANPSDYASECGLTFAAGGYANHEFSNYYQLFIFNSSSTNAGGLIVYKIADSTTTAARINPSALTGTEYYQKFQNWLESNEEETFTYTVRLEKTSTTTNTYYIGVDGEEVLSFTDTAFVGNSIIGFRAKNTNVYLANPKVSNVGTYTATFDANGGTIDGAEEKTLTISECGTLPTPDAREDYVFLGWYVYKKSATDIFSGEAVTELSTTSLLNLNATYVAKWVAEKDLKYTFAIDTGVSGYSVDSVTSKLEEVNLSALTHSLFTFSETYYYDAARTQPIDFTNFNLSNANVSGYTVTVYAKFTGLTLTGEGTATAPYQISSEADLIAFGDAIAAGAETDKYYKLTTNITLTQTWTPIKAGFTGTLDGGNFSITGMKIEIAAHETSAGTNKTSRYGFFAELGAGTVKDLTLVSVDIQTDDTSYTAVGGVAGYVYGAATISGVTVSGTIKASASVGGIVGYTENAAFTITNCVNNASVTATLVSGNIFLGGIVGSTYDGCGGTISSCKNYGTVTATGNGKFVGGIVGLVRAGTAALSGCYNFGNIVVGANSTYVGGIGGCVRITVTNCYCSNEATLTLGSATAVNLTATYSAISTASPYIGYLAGTSTSATQSGGGKCDSSGNAVS